MDPPGWADPFDHDHQRADLAGPPRTHGPPWNERDPSNGRRHRRPSVSDSGRPVLRHRPRRRERGVRRVRVRTLGHPDAPAAGWGGGNQIAIHGTNDPGSIGRGSSAGCIHVAAGPLQQLIPLLQPGTPIVITP
ncbi:MAG TPA: hypothetical protein DIU14_02930 [Actinobacteria bacterium]|nr:hypothetical protein [Actinomycetota bacterium]